MMRSFAPRHELRDNILKQLELSGNETKEDGKELLTIKTMLGKLSK